MLNNLYRNLGRKFGRFAIKNLVIYILATYAVGYVFQLAFPGVYEYIELNPELVMKGQVWRLFTWVFTAPTTFSIFTAFVFIFEFYVGQMLERAWGSFGYNLYIFLGLIFLVLSSMIAYWITGISVSPSTYYIMLTSFLAYAFTFPDLQVMLFFIIPVKVKWMAYAELLVYAYDFLSVGTIKSYYVELYGDLGAKVANQLIFTTRLGIIMSLLNFFLFYLMIKDFRRFAPKEIKRKQVFKAKVKSGQAPAFSSKHKCAICGKTEKDSDTTTFRFCSKCNGNYEFCDEHLYTHKHFE